jgi:hypothetical protein
MIEDKPTHQWLLDKLEGLPERSQYPIGEGIIKCRRSGSDPMGLYYQLYLYDADEGETGEATLKLVMSICTCEGFRFTDHCRHLEEGSSS